MTNEETIFAEALAKGSAEQRAEYLDEVCAGNDELRKQVDALLLAHQRGTGILESPPPIPIVPDEQVGSMIGPYKLLEQIGEGGMGAVYMAEQTHPVRRKVALKIIKPGLDTKQVIARFEAERQALALMDHPCIAKVLDAGALGQGTLSERSESKGATDAGRSYFVMELVRGIPITEYCDQHQLTPRQRLELFVQVCSAVQHAHQKGIIHRDIKPSNVLVTLQEDTPVPKIIDFGIAKATAGQRLTERTLYTQFRELIGTPLYMSPEQAEMSELMDVDTRSDVYSLGVLLYELLTGTTPFDKDRLAKAAYDEVRRIIREEDPPRPSTRLSTLGETLASVSAQRHTDPKKLTQTIRGELDWIVMKALEKDRARRYETAEAFSADIARYLSDQPVAAGPASRWYRARKVLRRHRTGVAASAAMILLLLGGITATTWQAIRATRAERASQANATRAQSEATRAEAEAANAKAVVEFLTQDVIGSADPAVNPGRKVTVEEALTKADKTVGDRFKDRPLVEAAVRDALGMTFFAIGRADIGLPNAQAALERRRALLGDDHPETLRSMNNLGELLCAQGRFSEAVPIWREALERGRRVLGSDHLDTIANMNNFAYLLERLGKYTEAEALFREALERSRRVVGEDHEYTVNLINSLAYALKAQGKFLEAEPLYREAVQSARRIHGDQHPLTLGFINNLALVLKNQGKLAEAEPLFRQTVDASLRVIGDDHVETLLRMADLGLLLQQQGNFVEAEQLFLKGRDGMKDNPAIPVTTQHDSILRLIKLYEAWNKPEEAAKWRAVMQEFHRKHLPATLPATQPTTPSTNPR